MSTESMEEIDKIRNNIEFASIAQFFHTFQSAFHPWPAAYNPASFLSNQTHLASQAAKRSDDDYVFATEDLENMLLKREERYRLQELIVRMLRLLTRNRFINADTWQNHFAKEIDKRETLIPNPFHPEIDEQAEEAEKEEDYPQKTEEEQEESINGDQQPKPSPAPAKLVDFFTLPILTRLHLLYLLCEWQLVDAAAFREHLDSEEDAVHWRVEPIGYDAKGSSYWLFDDNRLYKETPEPKRKRPQKKKPRPRARGTRRSTRKNTQVKEEEEEEEDVESWMPWKLICLSKTDWEELPKKFENSSNLDEQRFYDMLSNEVLPKVIPVLQEHEDQLKKKQLLANRKRSSRIMYKELAAIEHEQQVILEERAEKTRKSSRREEMERKREEDQKIKIAKAREERLRDRERRLEQREHAHEEVERKKAMAENHEKKPTKTHTGKKRGRKPKNKKVQEEEEAWIFDCVCGVSGQNIDDGTPMIACERCGKWQHIECLQKDGHISQDEETLNNSIFFCKPCQEKEAQVVDVDGFDDERTQVKKTKVEYAHSPPIAYSPQSQSNHSNGYHSSSHTPPNPMVQSWRPHLSQPQQQRPSQPMYPHPSQSSPQQSHHYQGNSDRFPSPVFPILKPMLPTNFSNGDHHQLPPLLPQAPPSIPGIQSIRPAPLVSLPKPLHPIPQPSQQPSPKIKLQLRPQLQPSESQQSYSQQPQPPPLQQQEQRQEQTRDTYNNGYQGSTHQHVGNKSL